MPTAPHRRPSRVGLSRRASKLGIGLALAAASPALSACVTVKPSQRGHLAKPEMDPSTDALEETFHSHVDTAREGSFGGHGASGGGCGCG